MNEIEGRWGTQASVPFRDEICGDKHLLFTSSGTYKIKIKDSAKWKVVTKTEESQWTKITSVANIYLHSCSKKYTRFYDMVSDKNHNEQFVAKYFETYPEEKDIIEFTDFKFKKMTLTEDSEKIYNQCKKDLLEKSSNANSQTVTSDMNTNSQIQVSNSNNESNKSSSSTNMLFVGIGVVIIVLLLVLIFKSKKNSSN